jgi:hypothetical protein
MMKIFLRLGLEMYTFYMAAFRRKRALMKSFCRILLWVVVLGVVVRAGAQERPWRRLERGDIAVLCHAGDIQFASQVMVMAEEVLPKIAGDLGLSRVGKVKIVVASSDAEFSSLTGESIPEWGAGAADAGGSTVFLKSPRFARLESNLRQIVMHELSHVALGMALNGKPVDRWFDEGFAQYVSGEENLRNSILFARSLLAGDVLDLNEVNDVLTFRREKAALAYEESRTAVAYLVEKFGESVLLQIVEAVKDGMKMDAALHSRTGMDFFHFQSEWRQTMKRRYLWYVLLDFPLMFSVVLITLFFAAFFITRKRIRKKKETWQDDALYGF